MDKVTEITLEEFLSKTTFKDVDCIKIPWIMMSCNKLKKNPKSILETNIYRWNHDLKHPHPEEALKIWKHRCCKYDKIEVKSMDKLDEIMDNLNIDTSSRLSQKEIDRLIDIKDNVVTLNRKIKVSLTG